MSALPSQPMPDYLQMITDDKRAVAYRPIFARLTGSATAAVLLQQIIHWWESSGKKPFYKFKTPCKNKLYKPGDSWAEELSFTRSEFDTAIKKIGTKIKQGMNRQVALQYQMPDQQDFVGYEDQYGQALIEAISHCVVYWTDGNRVTWYQVNETLLRKFISAIYTPKVEILLYLAKVRNQLYLVKQKSSFTYNTKKTHRKHKEDSLSEQIVPTALYFYNSDLRVLCTTPVETTTPVPTGWATVLGLIVKDDPTYINFARISELPKPAEPTPVPATPSQEETKRSIDQDLKDAVAEHIEKIDPKLGGGLTGTLAQKIAGVWRKKLNRQKLTADEYARIARSVPKFVEAYKEACDGCDVPKTPDKVESWYAQLLPAMEGKVKPTEPDLVPHPEDPNSKITRAQLRQYESYQADLAARKAKANAEQT